MAVNADVGFEQVLKVGTTATEAQATAIENLVSIDLGSTVNPVVSRGNGTEAPKRRARNNEPAVSFVCDRTPANRPLLSPRFNGQTRYFFYFPQGEATSGEEKVTFSGALQTNQTGERDSETGIEYSVTVILFDKLTYSTI